MPKRTTSSRESGTARARVSIEIAVFSPRAHALEVVCCEGKNGRELWMPRGAPRRGERLDVAARRIIEAVLGKSPTWMEQVGVAAVPSARDSMCELNVVFVGVAPAVAGGLPVGSSWAGAADLGRVEPESRDTLRTALAALRQRMDHAPIAFHLLPRHFTLSELQSTYEILLGKRLHKASFRRALQAAYLVEPTSEWRTEGRGRPAQFFEFSPRRRRTARRGVRFDLIGT